MTEPTTIGDNILSPGAGPRIKEFIERIEAIESEIADRKLDLKEIYEEIHGELFDVKVIKKIVKLRKQDATKRQEEEAALDLYIAAIGGL